MAASPSTGTCFRTRRLKLNRRADDRCSATGSRPEYGSVDAQAAKSGDRALGDLPPALSWQSRSPSGSKSIRKNCVSWNRKAPCCARSSPLKAQKRRVLACPVLYRNGAPDTIRTCDLHPRRGHSISGGKAQRIPKALRLAMEGIDKSARHSRLSRPATNESNPLGCCDIVKPVFPALSYDDIAPRDTITYAR